MASKRRPTTVTRKTPLKGKVNWAAIAAFTITATVISGIGGYFLGRSSVHTSKTNDSLTLKPTGTLARRVADYYYDQQDWPDAIRYYAQAIKTGEDNADTHTDFGNALRFADQPEAAVDQYMIAQKLDPHHENSLFDLGGVYAIALHSPQNAVRVWQDYLARFPHGEHVAETRLLLAQLSHASINMGAVVKTKAP